MAATPKQQWSGVEGRRFSSVCENSQLTDEAVTGAQGRKGWPPSRRFSCRDAIHCFAFFGSRCFPREPTSAFTAQSTLVASKTPMTGSRGLRYDHAVLRQVQTPDHPHRPF